MKSFLLLLIIVAGVVNPTTAMGDERIWETKNICGLYFASEINGSEAARFLGLKGTGRVGSRVEQYCNFFRSMATY